MRIDDYVDVLRRDGEALSRAAERAGPDAAVPTCPGWQVRDLLAHLGGVHRWAAALVTTRRPDPFGAADEKRFFDAPADDALLGWFSDGHRDLVRTLTDADPALHCWTFFAAPSPLAFWARRQAHETAIHRADAEAATASAPDWEPGFAADGIDELLHGFLARRAARITADPAVSLALAADDVDAAWTVQLTPSGLLVDAGAHPPTLTLTGRASDLYRLLWNRSGSERLVVRGDLDALETWRHRVAINWT
ncbi:maleylpyruvate isomerase family mycothiol-dependent enzyme [Cryptosporangium arvum]|uniref:maleylpyruvate isomerase family mycothiol-dependent enzyme n=1 Tax=Cryptosporangium arvum TaxID=80871 RepID=UPI0005643110|nr:maleylpyruvate isomerase family mycothiol-dependent enzyme [Cryptosporangium arvum]